MSKRIDLTGQRFGKLTVLEPAENIGGRTTWRCRCDCGKETVVPTGRLRSGETKSCGCQRDRIDLTGQRFGKLTEPFPEKRTQKVKKKWNDSRGIRY